MTTREKSIGSTIVVGLSVFFIGLLLFSPTWAQNESKSDANDEVVCGFSKDRLDPLIDEADRERFNTVRVEISGNSNTRHREFIKRMVKGLHEGDIFTRKALEKSLKRISKMKAIFPITMENVEIRLNREHKEIDILFCVKEKPKR